MRKESRLNIPAVERLIRWKKFASANNSAAAGIAFYFLVRACVWEIVAPCYRGYLTAVRFLHSTRGLIYLFPLSLRSKRAAPKFLLGCSSPSKIPRRKCEHFCVGCSQSDLTSLIVGSAHTSVSGSRSRKGWSGRTERWIWARNFDPEEYKLHQDENWVPTRNVVLVKFNGV